MDGVVEDGGHAPIDADISVSDELSKTSGHHDMRKPQYCPSWLQIDFRDEYVYTEIEVSDSDKANVVSSFK